jgi:hypothetical protein
MKILEEIDGFVSGKINVIRTMLSIIKLETKLAGLSVYPLLINLCMLLVILTAVWFSGLLLLGYFIVLTFDSVLIAMGSLLFLNVMLFVILLKYLSFNLKRMSFEKTREFFSQSERLHNDQEKKIDYPVGNDGKEITPSTE